MLAICVLAPVVITSLRGTLTPGTTSPLKKANASELTMFRLDSSSLSSNWSSVSPRFGHFMASANCLRLFTCLFFSRHFNLTIGQILDAIDKCSSGRRTYHRQASLHMTVS